MQPQFVFIFIALAAFFVVIITSADLWKAMINFISFRDAPIYFELFSRRLSKRNVDYLLGNDKYYRSLSPRLSSFNSRIKKFAAGKHFLARGDFKLNQEVMLVLATAAVKISFGLEDFRFSHFHTIMVYSDEFYSGVSQMVVKGETNGSGIIAFSWKDIEFGNSDPYDSINLAIHEFSHALFLTNLMNPYENDFKEHYREWLIFVKENAKLKEATQRHIFREYAAANEMEFFAVAVENFFEKPREFKEGLPILYELMCKVLNQDTLEMEKLELL